MITPPVGLNLYVASGISGMGLTETTKACAPWILVDDRVPAADHLRADHQPVAAEPADGCRRLGKRAQPLQRRSRGLGRGFLFLFGQSEQEIFSPSGPITAGRRRTRAGTAA